MRVGEQSEGGAQDGWPLDPNSSPDGLYSDGLTQLATELDQRYELDNISSISYALAVDLNCLDADDPEQKSACCLLADQNLKVIKAVIHFATTTGRLVPKAWLNYNEGTADKERRGIEENNL